MDCSRHLALCGSLTLPAHRAQVERLCEQTGARTDSGAVLRLVRRAVEDAVAFSGMGPTRIPSAPDGEAAGEPRRVLSPSFVPPPSPSPSPVLGHEDLYSAAGWMHGGRPGPPSTDGDNGAATTTAVDPPLADVTSTPLSSSDDGDALGTDEHVNERMAALISQSIELQPMLALVPSHMALDADARSQLHGQQRASAGVPVSLSEIYRLSNLNKRRNKQRKRLKSLQSTASAEDGSDGQGAGGSSESGDAAEMGPGAGGTDGASDDQGLVGDATESFEDVQQGDGPKETGAEDPEDAMHFMQRIGWLLTPISDLDERPREAPAPTTAGLPYAAVVGDGPGAGNRRSGAGGVGRGGGNAGQAVSSGSGQGRQRGRSRPHGRKAGPAAGPANPHHGPTRPSDSRGHQGRFPQPGSLPTAGGQAWGRTAGGSRESEVHGMSSGGGPGGWADAVQPAGGAGGAAGGQAARQLGAISRGQSAQAGRPQQPRY